MKKNIPNITLQVLIISFVVLLIGGIYKLKQPANKDTHTLKTYKQISSYNLLDEYDTKPKEHFIEKTLEINGTIKKIHVKNNIYTLYLNSQSSEGFILCELQNDQNHKIPKIKVGDSVQVKGVLKGKLLDIVLLNCIII